MDSLLNKRAQYIAKIQSIKTQLEIDMETYKKKLNAEYASQLAQHRAVLTQDANEKIKVFENRISVLDEMIREDMPEAEAINELITNKPIEETVEEPVQTVEETPVNDSENEIIDDVFCNEEEITENDQVIKIDETADAIVQNEELNISDDVFKTETKTEILDRPGMTQITIPSRI